MFGDFWIVGLGGDISQKGDLLLKNEGFFLMFPKESG